MTSISWTSSWNSIRNIPEQHIKSELLTFLLSHFVQCQVVTPQKGGGGGSRGWMSGNTHFLLSLCYLPFHLSILSLKDIYDYLQTSLSISEHHVKFPLPFVILSSVLSFTSPVYPSDGLGVDTDFTNDPYFYFYLHPCSFLSSFLSSFPYVTMSHLYSQGLNFPFTYSHRLPSSRSLSFSLRISC